MATTNFQTLVASAEGSVAEVLKQRHYDGPRSAHAVAAQTQAELAKAQAIRDGAKLVADALIVLAQAVGRRG